MSLVMPAVTSIWIESRMPARPWSMELIPGVRIPTRMEFRMVPNWGAARTPHLAGTRILFFMRTLMGDLIRMTGWRLWQAAGMDPSRVLVRCTRWLTPATPLRSGVNRSLRSWRHVWEARAWC